MGLRPLEEKLAKELTSPEPLTEARVVYMLVCIRKIMELDNSTLPSLRFHCDWALHSRLSRTEAAKIIKMFDNLEHALLTGDETTADTARSELRRVVNYSAFRTELKQFLENHKLPTALSAFSARWICFWDTYLRVISDVPLEFTSVQIRDIRKVVVKRVGEPRLPRELFPRFAFGVRFMPERFDGKPAMDHGLDYEVHSDTALRRPKS
jgi:hypothetical protein